MLLLCTEPNVSHTSDGGHTVLVVHRQLALDLLSDVGGHVCGVVWWCLEGVDEL